jgi:hypothetical protein
MVLDWTNPITPTPVHYTTWGWAYVILGLGGLGAVWIAYRFGKIMK